MSEKGAAEPGWRICPGFVRPRYPFIECLVLLNTRHLYKRDRCQMTLTKKRTKNKLSPSLLLIISHPTKSRK